MSSMMNHMKRSHRSEKVHRSGVMGMKRYVPRSAMPFTYDLTANASHLRAWLRRMRSRKKKGGRSQDGSDDDQ